MKIKQLLKYRTAWIGIAMIWIILYHSGLNVRFAPIRLLKAPGYGGVDICLFASGIGCYFSLAKDPDAFDFAKRRLYRLAPTYLCFIVLWLIGKALVSGVTYQTVLGNLLGIQNFTGLGEYFNWYISALILFYILAPYFKAIIDRTGPRGTACALAMLILCSVPFWTAQTYIITVSRLPIFFIGMFVGRLCADGDRPLTGKMAAGCIAAMLAGTVLLTVSFNFFHDYLWTYALYWYPFILITPGLCLCISLVLAWMENVRWLAWVKRMLDSIGSNSFELYLIHLPLVDIVKACIRGWHLKAYNNWIWLMFFAMMPVFCFCFKLYVRSLCSLVKKIIHRRSTERGA